MDRNIIIIVAAALVALATWFLVTLNQQPQEPGLPELEVPTPSAAASAGKVSNPYDFGDAPEYDEQIAETYTLYNGSGIQPTFPTAVNFPEDDWYVSHSSPFSHVFLGEITSTELQPELVNRDDDDGLLTERLQPCITQRIDLNVTVPFSYVAGTPLYLNGLFDWTQNGAWAGASDRCGFDVPEWGIQNLRLDQDPYNLTEPGIYTISAAITAAGGGNVWSRFTVTTEPVVQEAEAPREDVSRSDSGEVFVATGASQGVPVELAAYALAQGQAQQREWNGQGQFVNGETEDWIIEVLEGHQGLPVFDGLPVPPAGPNAPKVTGGGGGTPTQKQSDPLPPNDLNKKSKEKKEKQKGNNGLGNGLDPQPPGNPPCNDCLGGGPGNPDDKGGNNKSTKDAGASDKDKTPCNAGQGNQGEEASEDCPEGDPGKSADKNQGGDETSPNPGKDKKDDSGDEGKDDKKDDKDEDDGKGKDKDK